MAGVKRKGLLETDTQNGNATKKYKKEVRKPNTSKGKEALEAETDSDPIIESDTASQSGDDDGVSWPSDDEGAQNEEELEEWGGASDAGNDNGGRRHDADAVNLTRAESKSKLANSIGMSKCTSS